VPLKTVASGPASFALEGVPRFVRRAIDAIQSAFNPGPDDPAFRRGGESPPIHAERDVAAPPPAGEDS
jgi:hypothetical protein